LESKIRLKLYPDDGVCSLVKGRKDSVMTGTLFQGSLFASCKDFLLALRTISYFSTSQLLAGKVHLHMG